MKRVEERGRVKKRYEDKEIPKETKSNKERQKEKRKAFEMKRGWSEGDNFNIGAVQ